MNASDILTTVKKRGAGSVKRGARKTKANDDAGLTLFDKEDTSHGPRPTVHDGSEDA